jgi:ubiquinone/menaquinone biosynthesis C-methylase UbiE
MRTGHDRPTYLIRRHWDRRASTFDNEAGHGLVSDDQRVAWLNLLSRVTGPASQRVLDVGCGTGFVASRFAELGHTVTGVDLSPQMVDRAREKARQAALQITFQVGDAVSLDARDCSYDLVVARHVIWNLPDPRRGVVEWLRVLRPEGRLMLIEGKWADSADLEPSYRGPFPEAIAWAIDAAATIAMRTGRHRSRLLNRTYRHLEARLPFSGGPSATELVEFLTANSVREVTVEPLMDPALWGEVVQYPRYLVAGVR